jgi:ubiquinol-cytochrome c reductase cytochrome b subunit
LREFLAEPVRGGARWSYVFGRALACLILLQVATGVLLGFYYSPSTQEAWGSVAFVQTQVTLGWLVRGLHHFGASAMVMLLVLHMAQVFWFGAYRRPRQLGWLTGVVLLLVTLAFSLTGYLLPWDQRGYWATRVVTSIAGTIPAVGDWLKAILQGGAEFGNLTLTRFFGVHVFVLPAALFAMLIIHVWLFRRHGVTAHWRRAPGEIAGKAEPFWPRQVAYDLLFFALVVGAVAGVTIYRHGAPLEAPADPGANYLARPEWYFLWLFELLHFLPGRFEGIGVSVFVVAAVTFLAVLPFADRSPDASLRARKVHVSIAASGALALLVLTAWPMARDARDPGARMQRQQADAEAKRALVLARQGIPPGGAEELYLNDPHERGWRLFAVHCQACHKAHGKGGDSAPELTRFMSRGWVRGVVADPTTAFYFGRTRVNTMPKTDGTPQEIDLLTEYMLALGGAAREPPGSADLFEEKGCQACHARADEEPRSGPSLAGYGSRAWILGAIKTPGHASYYGALNQMPAFDGRLTDQELNDIVACLQTATPPLGVRR